ncbi:hypothetical protein SKC39_26060 [Mycolicibacterium sp. 120322]
MPLDGARAEEQLLPDLWIGASLAREVSDLFFLRRQVCAAWCGSTLRFLSGSLQLTSGLFGERGSAHRSEIRVRQSQLLACGCLLVGPAKPSAVAKACARRVNRHARLAQEFDGLQIARGGLFAV